MRGSGCAIFCIPAVKVTITSHNNGISVINTTTGFGCLLPSRSCIFSRIVVARQSAMAASIWLAMPNSGQSELMPPSGSRTPWIRKYPQPATISTLATRFALKLPVFPKRLPNMPQHVLQQIPPHPRAGIDGRENEQRLEHDREVIPQVEPPPADGPRKDVRHAHRQRRRAARAAEQGLLANLLRQVVHLLSTVTGNPKAVTFATVWPPVLL